MDDNAPITEGTFADGHDGIIRIYEDNDGNIIARLVKYSCGELNCVLYDGEPAFTSPSDPPYVTNPSDKGFGHLGPGATKNGLERQLDAEEEQTDLQKALASAYGPDGPQAWVLRMGFSTYGMTRGAEKFTTGQEKPLVLDYCRRIVEPTDPNLAPLLLRGARHGGRINVLFTDGRVDTLGPADLDPLMPGNRDLWKP
jgi:prepilin-type processing-associated H-X9-DG protein